MAELTRIGDILGQQAPETSSRREALRDSGGFVTPQQAKEMGLDWEELAVINGEHNFAPGTAEQPTVPDTRSIYRTARDFLRRHLR